ncbi:hypothetical protein GCM10027614_07630 [Micromonospora vulcania]
MRVPDRAGYCDQVPITFAVAVHGEVPLSKLGFPTTCAGVQPPPPLVTVQVKVAWAVRFAASVRVTVTFEVPAVVALPVIRPVDAPMVRPAGNPEALQVYGVVPPLPCTWTSTAWPIAEVRLPGLVTDGFPDRDRCHR